MSLVRPSEQLLVIPGESGLRRAVRRIKRSMRDLLKPRTETAAVATAKADWTANQRVRIATLIALTVFTGCLLAGFIALQRSFDTERKDLLAISWRTFGNTSALIGDSRALIDDRTNSELETIPREKWPASIAELMPFAVKASNREVAIVLNFGGFVPVHGYVITREGEAPAATSDRTIEAESDQGIFRYVER